MKRKKHQERLETIVWQKAANEIGANVILTTHYGWAGQVIYKSGATRYFRRAHLDLNPCGAAEIARYKCYSTWFLEQMGFPIIKGMSFFEDNFAEQIGSDRDIHAGYRYAKSLGFPVVVKPNCKNAGQGVARVDNRRDFYDCMRRIFTMDTVALVQEVVTGKEYRVVVLDDSVISAYERRPLEVTGDGKSTIRELLQAKRQRARKIDRALSLALDDYRLLINLRRRKLDLESVLPRGDTLPLLINANITTGGDAYDVLKHVHPGFKKLAVEITRKMGLRICGLDLMVRGDIKDPPGKYWIIEINPSPGLDAPLFTGEERAQALQKLFVKVLKAME